MICNETRVIHAPFGNQFEYLVQCFFSYKGEDYGVSETFEAMDMRKPDVREWWTAKVSWRVCVILVGRLDKEIDKKFRDNCIPAMTSVMDRFLLTEEGK